MAKQQETFRKGDERKVSQFVFNRNQLVNN